jgi:hypothetical protein
MMCAGFLHVVELSKCQGVVVDIFTRFLQSKDYLVVIVHPASAGHDIREHRRSPKLSVERVSPRKVPSLGGTKAAMY